MLYYGTKLSQNISKREPEGYLVCLNVPVARTGTQDYLPEELGVPPGLGSPSGGAPRSGERDTGFVTVLRPEEEVFSPECIASFEGMPVTDDHPDDPEGVTVETCSALQKGHAQNLRRGTGSESDLLIADLLITDPELIRHILSGKREISCGYNYELCQENGQYIQRKIRGNHIAVVDAGRAGHRVSIKDHKCERRKPAMQKKPGKNLMSRLIASYAKDEDTTIEEVAAIVEAVLNEDPSVAPLMEAVAEPAAPVVEVVPAEAPSEAAAVAVAVPEEMEGEHILTDAEDLPGVIERLDRVISLLEQLVTPAAADEDEPAPTEEIEEVLEAVATNPVEEAIERVIEEIVEETAEEPAALIDEDTEEEEQADCGKSCTTSDALLISREAKMCRPAGVSRCSENAERLRSVLQVMKPVIAAMPKAQRKQVSDALAVTIRKANGKTPVPARKTYAALKTARHSSIDAEDPRALGRKIMAARNANRAR